MDNPMPSIDKEKLIRDLIAEHNKVVQGELNKTHPDDRQCVIPETVHDYTEMFLMRLADIVKNL